MVHCLVGMRGWLDLSSPGNKDTWKLGDPESPVPCTVFNVLGVKMYLAVCVFIVICSIT